MKAAILVAKAFVVAFGIFHLFVALHAMPFSDGEAYWQAGERVRAGLALFPPVADPDAANVYRYAPWFAWAWAPITFLPKEAVVVAWTALLAVASGWTAWRIAAFGWYGIGLLAITAPLLLQSTIIGNVQPLLVAMLLFGLESRAGPVAVAISASLKLTPILLVAVYAGRGEWWRVAMCGVLTAALVAPLLFTDLSHYPGTAGVEPIPLPVLAAVGLFMTVAAAIFARTPYGWLIGSLAVAISQPRPNPYNLTFILDGLAGLISRGRRAQRS